MLFEPQCGERYSKDLGYQMLYLDCPEQLVCGFDKLTWLET